MSSEEQLPKSLIKIYKVLYKKVSNLIAGEKLSIAKDTSTILLLIEKSMVLIEKAKDEETGERFRGFEKRKYAIMLVKFIIRDLVSKGKIDQDAAEYILSGIDFWGGIAMDIAIDAAKKVINLGEELKVKEGCINFWKCKTSS